MLWSYIPLSISEANQKWLFQFNVIAIEVVIQNYYYPKDWKPDHWDCDFHAQKLLCQTNGLNNIFEWQLKIKEIRYPYNTVKDS